LAIIDSSFRDLADILDFIADLVFLSTHGCMYAQTKYELKNPRAEVQVNYNYVMVPAKPTKKAMQRYNAQQGGQQ